MGACVRRNKEQVKFSSYRSNCNDGSGDDDNGDCDA